MTGERKVRRGQVWRPKAGRRGAPFQVQSLDARFAYCTTVKTGVARRIQLARLAEDYELVREAPGFSMRPAAVIRREAQWIGETIDASAHPFDLPTCCSYHLAPGDRCRVCGEVAEDETTRGAAAGGRG